MLLFQRLLAYTCDVLPVAFVTRTPSPAVGRFAGALTSVTASTRTARGGGSVGRTAVSMTTAVSCTARRVLRAKASEPFVMKASVGGDNG